MASCLVALPAAAQSNDYDYDDDNDNLIDIRSLVQLNAVRYDLDGNGTVGAGDATNYATAFPNAVTGMGCPSTCTGYELRADLDFDTDGDGDVDSNDPNSYTNFAPIGGTYAAYFHGNGHVISNLRQSVSGNNTYGGLFHGIGSSGRVVALGLRNPNVRAGGSNRGVGAVAGSNAGTVAACYVLGGEVVGTANDGYVGGLVGRNSGTVLACYSTATVGDNGRQYNHMGGLVGNNVSGNVRASYVVATVNDAHARNTGHSAVGNNTSGNTLDVYYNSDVSTIAGSMGAGSGQTTRALKGPTSATGIYANWRNFDIDGDGTAGENPWDFGWPGNYPALRYSGFDVNNVQRTDHDVDNDGLIEIRTLGQLNAIRWDLDGNGIPATGDEANYYGSGAFPNAVFDCPTTNADTDDYDCLGYELDNDLDFDTDGDDATHTGGTGDSGDAYYNTGSGWNPIGPASTVQDTTHFNARFDGNGHVIDNLFVSRARNNSALFAGTGSDAEIVALGLPDAWVHTGTNGTGALAGTHYGRAAAVWASGSVSGAENVGGLVGYHDGTLVASYSTAAVACSSSDSGGLAGRNEGTIVASYSTGAVTGSCSNAGLSSGTGTFTASYWDTGLSGIADDSDSNPPEGLSTASMQAPTSYTSPVLIGGTPTAIYSTWDDQDVDGDGATRDGDDADPWDFGFSNQHPILKYRGLAAAPQLLLQPDTAPTFGTATVPNKTFTAGVPIEAFQLPATTAGNGVISYAVAGLPTGLKFDETGMDEGGCPGTAPRQFCGVPEAVTSTAVTVTITAADADSNMAAGDQATLTFTITVNGASFTSNPAVLTEAALSGATLTVTLGGFTFASGVTAASFELVASPNIPDLTIDSITGGAMGSTSAVLTLATGAGYGFDANSLLAVRVLAAAHSGADDLLTQRRPVAPTRPQGLTLSLAELALDEDPAGGGNVGTYTAVLNSAPTGCTGGVVVSVSSGDADLTVAPTSLTFVAADWLVPRVVTVTAGEDEDAEDDRLTVSHSVATACGGAGYPTSLALPALEVLVTDADDVFNLPPQVVGSVADLELGVGETARIQVAGLFDDELGADTLSHTVSSSSAAVVSARLTRQGFAELTGLANGVSTVTLTAWDSGGLSASLTFLVRVGVSVSFGGDASAPEGGVLRLTLVASRPAPQALSVPYVLGPGPDPATAADEADHGGGAGGTATIAAGAAEAVVEIQVLDDDEVEPVRERFTAMLAEPPEDAGYGVGANPRATLTIEEGVCDRSAAVRDALRFGRDCSAVADLSRHTSLRLAGAGLERLGVEDLLQLDRLRLLDLTDNEFAAWPAEALGALPLLDALRLDDNRLRSLPADLGTHPALAELWLTGNDLAELPSAALRGLGGLERLRLSDNALATLPAGAFEGLAALRSLWLDGNAVEELPDGLFSGLAQLEMLHLQGNPGAPFMLTAELTRTDAPRWAPGPASVALRVPVGAPFAMRGLLVAPTGTLPDGARISVPAGESSGALVTVAPDGEAAVTVWLIEPPRLPATECERGYGRFVPCFDGLATAASEPLTLFEPAPIPEQSLDTDDALRIDLAVAFEAAPGETLAFTAESSDSAVARVRVIDGELVVEAVAEGTATVTVTATDDDGQAGTLRFQVFATPAVRSQWHGWRLVVPSG